MNFDLSDAAGIAAACASGYITERKAKELLLGLGFEDDLLTTVLSTGAGIVTGGIIGSIAEDLFDDFF